MSISNNVAPGFRADINGLRAWAVVAVILYHFGVPGFGGGFVGVDVFFVISGMLMTGIVVSGLEQGTFSLLGFYMARARRIVPALVVLCAVLLALGWYLLPPVDYNLLSDQVIASITFLSNIKFWREGGYFEVDSHDKWLLHTWSLAVEWQFYLLLPLVLQGVWKLRSGRMPATWVMAAGFILSCSLTVALTPKHPTISFFLLPTRAWEMLAGGMVYLLAYQKVLSTNLRRLVEFIGLVLMMGSIVGFSSTSAWPGWRAMVPVLAAVLILLAARPNSLWTANRAAQWLGTRSYSLYLWHWPIVVALKYAEAQSEPVTVAAALALTAILGNLSFLWVEVPARKHLSKLAFGRGAAVLGGGAVVVAAVGLGVSLQHGILGRFTSEIDVTSLEALNKNPQQKACHPATGVMSPSCMHGGSQLRAIVIGDSHANAVVSSVTAAVQQTVEGVMEWSYSACPIVQGALRVNYSNNQCGVFVEWAVQQLKSLPRNVPLVIVNRHGLYIFGQNEDATQVNIPPFYFSKPYMTAESAFLQEYAQHLIDTTCKLAKDRPVYLVRPIPEMGVNVPNTARAMVLGRYKEVSVSLVDYHQRNDVIWAAQDAAHEQCGVKILDPLPYLCWDGVCHGAKDGRPLYFDSNHLSEFGNKLLVPMFAKVFEARTL